MGILNKIHNSSDSTKTVARNTFYAFIIKGLALVISFFSTPAFIQYFNNNEILGVWFTLLSVLMWFLTLDLGIGNGIRNHLVIAISNNDRNEMRNIISSGISCSAILTVVFFLFGLIVLSHINLNAFFNIAPQLITPSTLKKTCLLVFGALMMRFFLTSISSIFYALQKSSINNFLSLCVSILLLIYVLFFKFDNPNKSLENIALAYFILCNIPIIIAAIYIFNSCLKDCRPKIKYITFYGTKKIIGIGIIFFLCQICFLIISGTNEFFISHFWNPIYSADYSFYYRITMVISMIVSLALTPTWSMITKAYQEGNIEWVKKLYRLFKLTGIIIIICQFLLIPFLQTIMNIWLGQGQLTVDKLYALAFAFFGSAMLYSTMLSTIVCGLSQMKLQAWCYGIGGLLKIILIILIAKSSGQWIYVVWVNTGILTIYCLLEQIRLNKLFS